MTRKRLQAPAGLAVEYVPIADLLEDSENARRHDARNLEAIAGSLRQFGQQKPIVVNEENVVIAGNGTLVAARELRWTEIAVVRTKLTPALARAYAVADNRTGELATWDGEVLDRVLKEIEVEDADLEHMLDELAAKNAGALGLPTVTPLGDGEGTEGAGLPLRPHEHYDYLVVLATDSSTWNVLCERLGVTT